MRKIPLIIRVIAALMLIGGLVMIVVCREQSWEASINSRWNDSAAFAKVLWDIGFSQSIVTAISSFFVFGFSYIVEAACIYIDRCNQQDTIESEE